MQVSRRAFATVLTMLLLSGPAPSLAAEPAPEAPVREGYAITIRQLAGSGPNPVPAPWQPPHRDRLMSKGLALLFARDDLYQKEAGEIGNLGADPFLSGQDGEVKNLRVTVTGKPANGKALVTASFVSFKQPVSVRFRMIDEGGAWKIDDIVNRVDGKDYPVRETLTQPYACGSFMKKPCKR
ncbi:uncharacterized protein DUF3828 [Bosea sp. 124]|nr:uncharacterized protein DUF3828 [Bosea sp. 124]